MSDSAEGSETQKPEGEQAKDQKAQAADQNAEGFDVVSSEASDTPSQGNGIPLSAFLKNKDKWKNQVKQAKRDADALAAENELLRMQLEQAAAAARKPRAMPSRAEFETDEQHANAVQQWVDERAAAVATEAVRKHAPAQVQPQLGNEQAMQKHYERAAALKAADFEDAENEVIGALGSDAARQIVEQFDNSEAVMYALGKNPRKLAEMRALLHQNPVSAVVALTKYAAGLRLQPRGKAPEPDTLEKGTAAATDWQKKLQTLRQRVDAGKAKMGDVIAYKRELRTQGINPDSL